MKTLGNFSNILAPPKYVKKYETFEVSEQTKEEIDRAKSIVKVGDTVEQV